MDNIVDAAERVLGIKVLREGVIRGTVMSSDTLRPQSLGRELWKK
jgi:hypothetical protein